MRVIYEDNHLLVIDKPPNVPVQADASGDGDLLSQAKEYIKVKYQKPGAVYLGLVHRLDRPVGGLIVFARTSKAAARLSEQIRARTMRREYLCIVRGIPREIGTLVHWLVKDGATNTSRAVSEGAINAKRAELSFCRMDTQRELSLMSVRLHTGRSHQIRVQFAAEGFPLWGDARYGAGRPGEQIALFAHILTLAHPTTRETLSFRTEVPELFPWNLFKKNPLVV